MAKISAADKSRPLVEAFAKYHFWLLVVVVPLVLLPLLLMARGELAEKIETQRMTIDGLIKAMREVRAIPQHPNDSWTNDIDASTMRVKRETFAEWRKFWESQRPLRGWPASLGPDFVKTMETLKPDGKLSRKLLERYQNNALALVRELPKRMGAEDAIVDSRESGQQQAAVLPVPVRPPQGPAAAEAEEPAYAMIWSPESQNRIAASFNWDKVPSTAQVLLAQEELWVYGLLCDVVARVNKSATGPHNAAIAVVKELSVGYPAAEDNPGGQAGGRIRRVVAVPGGADAGGPPAPPGAEGGPGIAGRPPHPRFTAGQQRGGPPAAPSPEEGAVAASPDDQLRNWIYVNFDGKPLDAAELAAAVDCQMVHLMPFMMQMVIDERRIDSLLVELSTSPIPIDVRQIRINVTGATTVGGQPGTDPGVAAAGSAGRPHDVHIELRGTVGLATLPDEKIVGLEPGQVGRSAPMESGEKLVSMPPAAVLDRSDRRRSES